MEWLNYQHLLYFWTVARVGGVTRAAAELGLGQPTISGQLRALEESLGEKLFRRVGRNLELTEVGREVFRYADEIFSLGRELLGAVKGRPTTRPMRFAVGIADVVPKLVAHRLIQPALAQPERINLICREDKTERLLAELALHTFDLVLTDSPLGSGAKVRAFSHLLGECGVTFVGTASLARKYRRGFPRSLDGAPMLLPTDNTAVRRSLDQWFQHIGIRPQIRAEIDDSALLNVFGETGYGVFPVPSLTDARVQHSYRVQVIGHVDSVHVRYFAISLERRLTHPAVVAISRSARAGTFAEH